MYRLARQVLVGRSNDGNAYLIRPFFMLMVGLFINVCVTTLVRAQDIKVDNTAKYVGNGRYDWTVFLVAEKAVLRGIQAVEYTLHSSFQKPVQQGNGPNFSLSANGWGEFNVRVKIIFKDKKKPPTVINYWLQLFAKSKSKKSPEWFVTASGTLSPTR